MGMKKEYNSKESNLKNIDYNMEVKTKDSKKTFGYY